MSEWYRYVQTIVEEIDRLILSGEDDGLSLEAIAGRLGYSPFHTTRNFRALSGMSLRDYIRLRRLSFALIELRDSRRPILDIAVDYGFSSHEAFTRAFRRVYGQTPTAYRKNPGPVVLRTRINTFDRYLLGKGDIGMAKADKHVKIYFVRIPAHKFMFIKNYESDGYFDFWQKQEAVPGQDCDTICGLLDSIKGKLDGDDSVIGAYSGQVMGYLREPDGRLPECYGVRLPADYTGAVPLQMQITDVAEGEYIVFEHGSFDYESGIVDVGVSVEKAMADYDYAAGSYEPDCTPGRVGYFYCDPASFFKRVVPVTLRG